MQPDDLQNIKALATNGADIFEKFTPSSIQRSYIWYIDSL